MGIKGVITVIFFIFLTGMMHGCIMENDDIGSMCTLTVLPTSGKAPLLVTFTFTASVFKGDIASWELDTNTDGAPEYQGSGFLPSNQPHVYQDTGTFTATLTIKDNCGIEAIHSISVWVYDEEWQPRYGIMYTIHVTHVIDGDTLDARLPDGNSGRIRFLGIDTPEINAEDNKHHEYGDIIDLDCLAQWGIEAKYFTREWIEGKDIFIEFDETAGLQTSERWLSYVYLENGTDFCALLIKKGYARAYMEGTCSREYYYFNLQQQAIDEEMGLWGCTGIEEKGLYIVIVNYNVGGNDEDNLNDEYVVIQNKGGDEKDLSGWKLEDEKNYVYNFPDGFSLAAGAWVTSHTGSGINSDKDLYWGNTDPVWNNNHDTAYLKNPSGSLVDSWSW